MSPSGSLVYFSALHFSFGPEQNSSELLLRERGGSLRAHWGPLPPAPAAGLAWRRFPRPLGLGRGFPGSSFPRSIQPAPPPPPARGSRSPRAPGGRARARAGGGRGGSSSSSPSPAGMGRAPLLHIGGEQSGKCHVDTNSNEAASLAEGGGRVKGPEATFLPSPTWRWEQRQGAPCLPGWSVHLLLIPWLKKIPPALSWERMPARRAPGEGGGGQVWRLLPPSPSPPLSITSSARHRPGPESDNGRWLQPAALSPAPQSWRGRGRRGAT